MLHKLCQKVPVKRESLSLTILSGMPWCAKMLSRNKRATSSADASSTVGMKCDSLESLSTTTRMAVCPCLVFGRCVMKSIETSLHLLLGTGSGCSKPPGRKCPGLFRWHWGQTLFKCECQHPCLANRNLFLSICWSHGALYAQQMVMNAAHQIPFA